jgi:hypothetical protein
MFKNIFSFANKNVKLFEKYILYMLTFFHNM